MRLKAGCPPKALLHTEGSRKQARKGVNPGLQCTGRISPLNLPYVCLSPALRQRFWGNMGRRCRLRLQATDDMLWGSSELS